MTNDETIEKIAALSPEQRADLAALMGWDVESVQEPKAEVSSEKVKCKVCGFAKKSRRVSDGVCKSCRTVLDSTDGEYAADAEVQVVGRMGKRGRNTVSVMIDGRRWKVKRFSPKHSERVAAKYASKGKGYARKPKAHVSDIVSPKGLPTSGRLFGDEREV